jgi:hypothetical protein
LLVATLTISGCGLFPQRSSATAATASNPSERQDECERLREQIRTAQQQGRRAPTTSADQTIVSAAQAKADQRVEDLQSQYDAQNCTAADRQPQREKTPPLPPAPGRPLQ